MIRTLLDDGINWSWYLQASFNTTYKTCHVYFFNRWHKYEERDLKHPKHENVRHWSRLEDDKRILYGIKLEGIEYLVTNPKYIFDYRDMTYYVAE